jgi:hypothetical protein
LVVLVALVAEPRIDVATENVMPPATAPQA